jgi:hypothetical protein
MRILLATEGESDEVVAGAIVRKLNPEAVIDPKKFPARGFQTVLRLLPDLVRAAHFGFYDLLTVHFDLDETLPSGALSVAESPRWRKIQTMATSTIQTLRDCNRPAPLRVALMAPCQSTDAWLGWGLEGGDGLTWEARSRHDLKTKLYGRPPLIMADKAREYSQALLNQLDANSAWPLSLREFWSKLETGIRS